MSHVCTCGHCELGPFVDKCRYEVALRARTLFLVQRTQPHPETRVDLGAEMTETLGLAASKESAEEIVAKYRGERLLEAAIEEGYTDLVEFRSSDDFYDPDEGASFPITPMEVTA